MLGLALGFVGRSDDVDGGERDDEAGAETAEETRRRGECKGVDFVDRRVETGRPVLGDRGGSWMGGSTICGIVDVDVEEEGRERERRFERRKGNFLVLLLLFPSSSMGETVRVDGKAALVPVPSSTSFSSIELTDV